MEPLAFIKMHGLGNDFVVIDGRARDVGLNGARARAISDRRTGVGCDQVIVIENSEEPLADAFMRIFNSDGSQVSACGNATRCVASLLMKEKSAKEVTIQTLAGLLDAEDADEGLITVDMGRVGMDWRDMPLSEARDTRDLGIESGPLKAPVGVSVGNPHAVFFVDDAEAVDLETHGPVIERHPLFPEYVNVEAAQVVSPSEIRVRVWERGAGLTRACGTGACASLVAAARRGLTTREADVVLDGGRLRIQWLKDDHVLMTGPVATSFTGAIDGSLLA